MIENSDLLANDTDAEGDTLTITEVSTTSANGATVTLNDDGTISYDPTNAAILQLLNNGETITDTFTYTISDGNGGTDTATVSIEVNGISGATFIGTSANDSLFGSASDDDFLQGLAGNDQLKGYTGDDFFKGGEGNDDIFGYLWGDGGDAGDIDTVIYDGDFSDYTITRSFYTNSARSVGTTRFTIADTAGGGADGVDEGTDRLFDIDILVFNDQTIDLRTFKFEITGTAVGETLTGKAAGNDLLLGLAGNDQLKGYTGDDFFNGGAGNDTIFGNLWGDGGDAADIDTAIYDGNITDYSFLAIEYTNYGRGGVVSTGIIITDDASGGADGIDEGQDTLVDIDFIEFADGNIIDVNAIVLGTSASDTLVGDDGNNTIVGYDGADSLTGGTGVDTFYFNALSDSTSTETDVITDFVQGEDFIAMFELDINYSDLNITNDGANTKVELNGTDFEIELNGVHALTQDDFIL